jgi:hypothetical protein
MGHFSNDICTWLHDVTLGGWTEKYDIHEWPPLSPDLRPLGSFFFVGVSQGINLLNKIKKRGRTGGKNYQYSCQNS